MGFCMNRFTLPFYQTLALSLLCLPLLSSCGSDNSESTRTTVSTTVASTEIKDQSTAASTVSDNASETAYWATVAIAIKTDINESLALAQAGETKLAVRKMGQAYFQQFEGSKMETALRVQISPKHMLKVEKLFGDLRKSIKDKAETAVLQQQANAIIEAVIRDAKVLDQAGVQAELLEGI